MTTRVVFPIVLMALSWRSQALAAPDAGVAGESPAAPASDEGVAVYQEENGRSDVVHVAPDGTKTVLFGRATDLAGKGFAYDAGRLRFAYRLAMKTPLYVRVAEAEIELPDSEYCNPLAFLANRPWLVGVCRAANDDQGEPRLYDADDPSMRVVIWDQQTGRLLQQMPGYLATVASADDTIYLLRKTSKARVEVRRLVPGESASTVVQKITLSDQSPGPYGVTGLAALDARTVAYRISDEHEHRFYLPRGKPFFPGSQSPDHREQYNLTFSKDGRFAAYAERPWGGLTYLVIVDLRARKRIQTKVYGSFPRIVGDAVYFMSDPSFVQPKDRTFRQIVSFVLYRYDIASGDVRQIAAFNEYADTH